jgi:hypothetical protein
MCVEGLYTCRATIVYYHKELKLLASGICVKIIPFTITAYLISVIGVLMKVMALLSGR